MSEQEVEAVLRAHVYQGRNGYAEEPYGICTCGWSFDAGGDVDELARWSAHVAAALAPLIAERERALVDRLEAAEAKAARVRDVVDRLAADDLDYDTSYGAAGQMRLLDDLRAALSAPQPADAPEGHGDADEAGERP